MTDTHIYIYYTHTDTYWQWHKCTVSQIYWHTCNYIQTHTHWPQYTQTIRKSILWKRGMKLNSVSVWVSAVTFVYKQVLPPYTRPRPSTARLLSPTPRILLLALLCQLKLSLFRSIDNVGQSFHSIKTQFVSANICPTRRWGEMKHSIRNCLCTISSLFMFERKARSDEKTCFGGWYVCVPWISHVFSLYITEQVRDKQ